VVSGAVENRKCGGRRKEARTKTRDPRETRIGDNLRVFIIGRLRRQILTYSRKSPCEGEGGREMHERYSIALSLF